MSGLLALLDDVAAIAKVAASSVDDVVGQAVKASSKAAGALIDDAAVTPKYVHGFSADREIPIVWKIARGSLFNKLVILLPLALLLSTFAPWAITPLLMLGGAYLCFEGAEKVWHAINPNDHHAEEVYAAKLEDAHLEEKKVAAAIKTDFILSAEIMTITLAALPEDLSIWFLTAALAVAGLLITVVVYGAVALIVKADDLGLHMASAGRLSITRKVGVFIVRAMPKLMWLLVVVGTAAMIWVGGSIILHGLHDLGLHAPYDIIHDLAVSAAAAVPSMAGAVEWTVTAFLDGLVGLFLGLLLIPVAKFAIDPVLGLFRKSDVAKVG
ncbi:MAG: ABC transporter [Maritimibacter sp.]|nr:ABC transporter [Maritimibacter sp.]